MTIHYRTDFPAPDALWTLFLTTGWNDEYHLSREELHRAVNNSWYTIAAYAGDRLAGFGRLVSDGVLHAMVYELITDPEFQNQGIGTAILDGLLKKCHESRIREIQLFSAKGKRSFYERRGFSVRPADSPGMQYDSSYQTESGYVPD
jgi:GNAT superfamily N-acetyltransferase